MRPLNVYLPCVFLTLLLSGAQLSHADTRAQTKQSLKACIDRILADRDLLKEATVDHVLLKCSIEYSSFMASLDNARLTIYPQLIHGYVNQGLQAASP